MIDNGRVITWQPSEGLKDRYIKMYNFNNKKTEEYQDFSQFEEEINPYNLKFKCSSWQQFLILFRRSSQQIYRNKVVIKGAN